MMPIAVIAGHEVRALYRSPLAWVILAVFQSIMAFEFLAQIELFLALQPRL